MKQEYPGARLYNQAAKVLLSVLLTREREIVLNQPEFAILTGLSRHLVASDLSKLVHHNLITIVPQVSDTLQGVPLVRQEYPDEKTVVQAVPPQIISSAVPAAPQQKGVGVQLGARSVDVLQDEQHGQPALDESLDDEHWVGALRYADAQYKETGKRKLQIQALKRVWLEAFPLPEYEYSQLQDAFARTLLNGGGGGRTSEWIGECIYLAAEKGGGRIEYPRGYVTTVIESQEAKLKKQSKPINGEVELDMDLMRQIARSWKGQ